MSNDAGRTGSNALRIDFDFNQRGGWAAFRHTTNLRLPENYEFSFWLKGDAPRNTLEFKLVDATGENVWWVRRPDFEFRGDWRKITFRKRHVTFAWGPKGGGDITSVAAIEFAITAGEGGKGTLWIDELTLTPREPVRPYDATPVVSTRANAYTIDFTRSREFGGIIIDWQGLTQPHSFTVSLSNDGRSWADGTRVYNSERARDYIRLPESEARFVRVLLDARTGASKIRDVRIMPIAWGESHNHLFETAAADAPVGSYPKYFRGVQSYWTITGANGGEREAMMNEEGAVEFDKRSFSIEPFLYHDGKLITWADVTTSQALADGNLPIPAVTWQTPALTLETTAAADETTLWLRYRVTNRTDHELRPTLYLAARPFQVNPTTQFLNTTGGYAEVDSFNVANLGALRFSKTQIAAFPRPAAAGGATFDMGDVVTDYLRRGRLPERSTAGDPKAAPSAALQFPLVLPARASREVYLAVGGTTRDTPATAFDSIAAAWRSLLGGFRVHVPGQPHINHALRANLAYILINRDGPAIQPGSRSYERSWIRDGALTSAALLRLGRAEEVRQFVERYAPFQYEDGKVPCCVDRHGAGAVPENDSHGQLIYAIAEYFRYTNDTALVRRTWRHIEGAVAYMDSLRISRRTDEYRSTGYWGMMPQSISHEGYSAKPMHSYWDDFFALKGFKDAAWLAERLGESQRAGEWGRMRDEFNADLMKSFEWTMQKHGIDYLAGSVELGDFDATSTTVGLNPAGAGHDLPQAALRRTFERYWDDFVLRRANWQQFETRADTSSRYAAYTPYEWRVVGALVRLGERERASEVLDWFMGHRRPPAWNHWAEVVHRDARAARFIGDMPHTWVGSDFIRSVLDMFVYDESDTLVIAAGIAPEWLASAKDTTAISGIHTPYGELAYRVFRDDATGNIHFRFDVMPRAPRNGFSVRSPYDKPIRSVRADGRVVPHDANTVRLDTLPRELVVSY